MAGLAQSADDFVPESVDELLVEPTARLVAAADVVPDGRRIAQLAAANVARVAAAIAGGPVFSATVARRWILVFLAVHETDALQVEHSRVRVLVAGDRVGGGTSDVDALPVSVFFVFFLVCGGISVSSTGPVELDDGTDVTSLMLSLTAEDVVVVVRQ